MNIVLDVGNSNIVCGVYKEEEPLERIEKTFRLTTPRTTTTDELALGIKNMLAHYGLLPHSFSNGLFCSVVPSLNHNITKLMQLYFKLPIHTVSHDQFCDFEIAYRDKTDLGLDRLVNLKAAVALFELPLIVVDLGTAITIDVVQHRKRYLGGLIMPGLAISLNALVENTSKLPKIELTYPQKLLGNSTKESMQNGLYFLHRLGIQNLIQQIRFQYLRQSQRLTVVFTGGLASFLSRPFFDKALLDASFQLEVVPNLTLLGLKFLLSELNTPSLKGKA